jgi:hypothetical protein
LPEAEGPSMAMTGMEAITIEKSYLVFLNNQFVK